MLFGHGGSQHKKVAHIPSFAKRLAAHGWASVAIDAPGHGDRVSEEEKALSAPERAQAAQERMRTATGEERKAKALMAVAEWRATLDAVEGLDDVGAGPTGYWGVSMGTMFGVPLLAEEPRISCAVLGLMGAGLAGGKRYEAAASSITIPLQFILQWDDELVPPVRRRRALRDVRFNREDADREPGRARGGAAVRVRDQRGVLPASPRVGDRPRDRVGPPRELVGVADRLLPTEQRHHADEAQP